MYFEYSHLESVYVTMKNKYELLIATELDPTKATQTKITKRPQQKGTIQSCFSDKSVY